MTQELESTIENYLVREMKKVRAICRKYTSPSYRIVPDRLIIFPNGKIVFIELKRNGAVPTEAQLREHERLRKYNQLVLVIDSKKKVDEFLYKFRYCYTEA